MAVPLVILAAPGGIIGAAIYSLLSERATAAILGLFLLALLAFRSLRPKLRWQPTPACFAVLAMLFGLLNGPTVGAGILVLPLLMVFGLAGAPLVATVGVVGLGMNLTKAASLGVAGTITPSMLVYGIAIGICTVPGAYVARYVIKALSLCTHMRLIDATVFVAAALFLWRAAFT